MCQIASRTMKTKRKTSVSGGIERTQPTKMEIEENNTQSMLLVYVCVSLSLVCLNTHCVYLLGATRYVYTDDDETERKKKNTTTTTRSKHIAERVFVSARCVCVSQFLFSLSVVWLTSAVLVHKIYKKNKYNKTPPMWVAKLYQFTLSTL